MKDGDVVKNRKHGTVAVVFARTLGNRGWALQSKRWPEPFHVSDASVGEWDVIVEAPRGMTVAVLMEKMREYGGTP